jgi:glycosyltransferase involved in cell wall biosynthesis
MSEHRRVGYVLKQYPRLSETFVLNEILGVEAAGVDVTVYSLRPPTEGRFHAAIAQVQGEVHYLPRAEKLPFFEAVQAAARIEPAALERALAFCSDLPSEHRAETLLQGLHLAAAVRRDELDHLHAHFMTIAARTAHVAHLLTGVGYTVTAHAKDIYRSTVDWDVLGRIAAAADAVITVCDANLRYLSHRLDGSGARLQRIYNGLGPQDPPAPLQQRRRGLVLGVGRLVEKKGFDVMIDSIAHLAAVRPEVTGVIVGDGEDREQLERRVDELGLTDRIRFTGALPQDQVAEWLRSAHVVVAPCRVGDDGNQDALPTVLLEALGAGTPAVSTPVAGIPEIVEHGRHGLLVPSDDPVALAMAVAELIDDDRRWQDMSDAGPIRLAERFDRTKTVAALVQTMRGAELVA